jgi:hypothetical protein
MRLKRSLSAPVGAEATCGAAPARHVARLFGVRPSRPATPSFRESLEVFDRIGHNTKPSEIIYDEHQR